MTDPQQQRRAFKALQIRSPMVSDGEAKDQDRVYWSEAMATACVCDGVTSSAHSQRAAEICARFSPVLFKDEKRREDNLRALADLLVVQRSEAQLSPIQAPPGASLPMQAMLSQVMQESMAHSFQTTLVASSFLPTNDAVIASVVWVGDSAFIAYSGEGETLATSLPDKAPDDGDDTTVAGPSGGIRLGPGDEILAKVLFDAAERPMLAIRADIRAASAGNWLVCVPLDQTQKADHHTNGRPTLWLSPTDLIFVPRYHTHAPNDPKYRRYRKVRYCQAIRSLKTPTGRQPVMQDKTHMTAVMPDHFYSGDWQHFQERFPKDAQFVLASDGFYSCFRTPREMWLWLTGHMSELRREGNKAPSLERLHGRLQKLSGDDDISFVWVESANTSPGKEGD